MAVFEVKTRIHFGGGERKKLLQYLAEHHFTKCGAVIDKGLLSYDLFKDWMADLEKELNFFKVLTYDFNREPTYAYLDSVKGFFKEDEIDCLIGLGGGSVMDVAKGLAVLINNPVDKSIELRGFPKISNLPKPMVAVPTVSGTGSEVTYNAVFVDDVEKRKLGINTKYNFPVFAIADCELALSAPLAPSLSAAFDCLVHSLESFMSRKATFVSRPLAMEAFKNAFWGINGLFDDYQSMAARQYLMKASYLAGIALMNSSAGPAGALSCPLGSIYGVAHGLAGVFFLQHILKYNLMRGYIDFHLLYDKINGQNSIPKEKKANIVVARILEVIEKAGVPKKLSEFGVGQAGISDFFYQATNYLWAAFEMNPVAFSKEDLNKFLVKIS